LLGRLEGGASLTALLAAYGIAGVLGTWAGERLASTRLLPGFIAVALTVAGSIALVGLGARHDWAVVLGMVSWGAAFGALPVCVQIWIHQAAPERFESGSALMVTVFQLAAAGALIGGQWVDHVGLGAAFATGTVLALAAALVLMAFASLGTAVQRWPRHRPWHGSPTQLSAAPQRTDT
jgi:predicted MFS family arabinose efflux permease